MLDSAPAELEYFDLDGVDRFDLLMSCTESCPRDEWGNAVGSLTAWSVDWQWTRGSSEPCVIDAVDTHVAVSISVPRWSPPVGADPGLVEEWRRYLAALETHEEGHVELVRSIVDGSVDRVRAAGCAGAREESVEILAEIRREQLEYDRVTDSGRAQGANFWGIEGRETGAAEVAVVR